MFDHENLLRAAFLFSKEKFLVVASDDVKLEHFSRIGKELELVTGDSLSDKRVVILNNQISFGKASKFASDQMCLLDLVWSKSAMHHFESVRNRLEGFKIVLEASYNTCLHKPISFVCSCIFWIIIVFPRHLIKF